jgi:hypothetical protein
MAARKGRNHPGQRVPMRRPASGKAKTTSGSVLDRLAGVAKGRAPRPTSRVMDGTPGRSGFPRPGGAIDDEIRAEVERLAPPGRVMFQPPDETGPMAMVRLLKEQLLREQERSQRLEQRIQQFVDRLLALTAPHALSLLPAASRGSAALSGATPGNLGAAMAREQALEHGGREETARPSSMGRHVRTPPAGLRRPMPAHPAQVEQAADQAEAPTPAVGVPAELPFVEAQPEPPKEGA